MSQALSSAAYILRHHAYGESSAVLVALTASHGKIRCDFKGAKGARRPGGAGLEPLTLASLQWAPGAELGRISSLATQHAPLTAIRGYWQGAFLEYVAGLLDALAPEQEPQPGLFRLAAACAGPLLAAPPWAALIYCEFFALHLAGFLPDLEKCPQCGRAADVFLVGPAAARCGECPGNAGLVRFAGAILNFYRRLRRTPPEALAALAAGENLAAIEAPLAVLLRAALEKEIPGRPVLITLFKTAS